MPAPHWFWRFMYDRESAAWERGPDEPEQRELAERTADELANLVAPPGPVADLGCENPPSVNGGQSATRSRSCRATSVTDRPPVSTHTSATVLASKSSASRKDLLHALDRASTGHEPLCQLLRVGP